MFDVRVATAFIVAVISLVAAAGMTLAQDPPLAAPMVQAADGETIVMVPGGGKPSFGDAIHFCIFRNGEHEDCRGRVFADYLHEPTGVVYPAAVVFLDVRPADPGSLDEFTGIACLAAKGGPCSPPSEPILRGWCADREENVLTTIRSGEYLVDQCLPKPRTFSKWCASGQRVLWHFEERYRVWRCTK